ncbi:pyridoxamine 5'-phosphate oxidase [Knoellia subterranea]|uniref:Pyridoxamine 5'-phosphate oxidase n=1 Tax=Knoellia subterranea KCTC 19937 TaxID=1385521 RepID=A0A0A0JGP8_9MICO|nr:pyridoxamine 5'-phosphate oxidase [Knoellia subterranea]KGN36323.1 pyridoxamine 5'-phosphate oxidase [Knoellia subterranea KCTC 19937]
MNDVTRVDYTGTGLSEEDVAATPWLQAQQWLDDAVERSQVRDDVPEPHALSVATVDAHGVPNVRTVLMRFFDERGPGFLTNTLSAKGTELAGNDAIAASLTWPAMFRAIRFRGRAVLLDRDEVDDYFVTRPWGSRISAWTSRQSQPATSRSELEAAYEKFAAQWPDTGSPDDVPTPDFWGGYRITCDEVEFWGGRTNRLHDRLVFSRVGDGSLDDAGAWSLSRRQP